MLGRFENIKRLLEYIKSKLQQTKLAAEHKDILFSTEKRKIYFHNKNPKGKLDYYNICSIILCSQDNLRLISRHTNRNLKIYRINTFSTITMVSKKA